MKKVVIFLSVLILMISAGIFLADRNVKSIKVISPSSPSINNSELISSSASAVVSQPIVKEPISIVFAGDVMLDRSVWSKIKANGISFLSQKIDTLLDGGDRTVANLEGPVTDRGSHAVPNGSMLFKFEPNTMDFLADAKITDVSLANNHTRNQGQAGLDDTRINLKTKSIINFGDPKLINKDITLTNETIRGKQVIFFGWNLIEVADDYEPEIMDLIKQNKTADNLVIVLPHWGNEYKPHTKEETRLAHELIDSGADLVIGGHPHTAQGIEKYNNHFIVYSLGNFLFDQYWSDQTQQGLVVQVDISDTSTTLNLRPVDLRNSQPRPAGDVIANTILERIAADSDESLRTEILNRQITLVKS